MPSAVWPLCHAQGGLAGGDGVSPPPSLGADFFAAIGHHGAAVAHVEGAEFFVAVERGFPDAVLVGFPAGDGHAAGEHRGFALGGAVEDAVGADGGILGTEGDRLAHRIASAANGHGDVARHAGNGGADGIAGFFQGLKWLVARPGIGVRAAGRNKEFAGWNPLIPSDQGCGCHADEGSKLGDGWVRGHGVMIFEGKSTSAFLWQRRPQSRLIMIPVPRFSGSEVERYSESGVQTPRREAVSARRRIEVPARRF